MPLRARAADIRYMQERPICLVLGFIFVYVEYDGAPLQASTAVVNSSTRVKDARSASVLTSSISPIVRKDGVTVEACLR